MINFGINGFGRIGRTTCRIWWLHHRQESSLAMINTSGSMEIEDWAYLLKRDTNYGKFAAKISVDKQQSRKEVTDENPTLGTITITQNDEAHTIVVTAQRDPEKLPWSKYNVETIIESTGVFRTQETAAKHFKGGAKRIILSAPSKGGAVSTSVIGVNQFDTSQQVFSNASCTTNCVAPVTRIMEAEFGIQKAMLTTIHAYTASQNLVDNSHKDMRRARAAASNIVPTTTGAAIATTEIIPSLENKFDGMAIRIPTPVGSLSDLVFVTKRDVTVEEVNQAFIKAAQSEQWQGILTTVDQPIVSSDIVGRSESSIVDLSFTKVVGGNLVKVLSWYDNEWAYCHRLIEQLQNLPQN